MWLYLSIVFHLSIFLFLLLAGFVYKPCVYIIVVVLIPICYIFQSFPLHILIKQKLLFIMKQHRSFKMPPEGRIILSDTEIRYLNDIAQHLNKSEQEVILAYRILKYYEEPFILPSMFYKFWKHFDGVSFANPFSPQGILIISFYINVLLIVFKK